MAAPSIAISLLLLTLGSFGGWYVHRLQKSTARLVALDMATIHAAGQLKSSIKEIRTELTNFALTSDRSHLDAITGLCVATEEALQETESLVDDEDELALVGQIRRSYHRFLTELQGLPKTPEAGHLPSAVEHLINQWDQQGPLAPAQELVALEERLVHKSSDYNQGLARWIALVLWLLGACGALAGLVAGFGIARSITRSIVELYVPVRAASGRLEEVIGPVDVAPSAGIENLDIILRSMADRVGTVVDRLRQSEREVLRAEQMAALGQLAAGLAHELRNPLTAMKMLIQAATQSGPGASLSGRDLAVLEAETTRLERSIQTFLDFARPPTLERWPGDLREALQQTLDLICARAQRQGVNIQCELAEQPLMIEADHEQLRQLFLNLLFNALDVLPNGGSIRIAAAPSQASGQPGIMITVTDNGPGIPSDLGDRVFDPYVSTKDTGLGLGLAICRRIVQSHGGRITAATDPQGGAVFSVWLPCKTLPAPGAPDTPHTRPA